MTHLAVFTEPWLTDVLQGRKTVESRFSKHKIAPYGLVRAGDKILLKRSSGPVMGEATAGKVEFIELNDKTWPHVRSLEKQLCVDATCWRAKAHARYATLIWLKDVHHVDPYPVEKKDRRGWVMMNE